jgi:hypothetical protein
MSCAEKVVAGTSKPSVSVELSPDPPPPPPEDVLEAEDPPPQADTASAMTATAAIAKVLNRNIVDPL